MLEGKLPRVGKLRILLAEDSLVNQKLAVALLEEEGHAVTVVTNGREACASVESGNFDLVLMDVQMPEMDGLEATARIRAREKQTETHIPIIAMTAHALKGDRERCLEVGMDAYVTKPIRADELLEAIEHPDCHSRRVCCIDGFRVVRARRRGLGGSPAGGARRPSIAQNYRRSCCERDS